MLIKILTFNVCVHLHGGLGGGSDVGGFINRAVSVIIIELYNCQLCISELLPL